MQGRRPKRSGALYRGLPTGTHGIGREEVERHQRTRLHGAMVSAVVRHGYAKTTIAHIVDLASVSRTTFYQYFAGKEECFLETHDQIAEAGIERVVDAYRSPGDWRQRLRTAFAAFVETVTERPDAARLVLVEALAAGPRALEHRERYTQMFEGLIRQGFDEAPEAAVVSDVTIRAIVGGIRQIVYQHLRQGTPDRLPAVVDDLVDWALSYREPGVTPPPGPRDGSRDGRPPRPAPVPAKPDPTRDRLTLSHRERILQAVSSIVYERDYRSLTVPEISAAAGMSNQTFYDHFAGKEQAFIAAFDEGAQRTMSATLAAVTRETTWEAGIKSGMGTLLDCLVSDPAFARVAFLHAGTAGKVAQERAETTIEGFGAFLAPGFEQHPGTSAVVRDAIVGGVWNVLYQEVAHDHIGDLPALALSLTFVALAPFTGAAAAAEVAGA
jgi:AcrR family transcriptional regulator